MSEFPYLYRNSFEEAERYGKLGKWRSSHQENITCRKDIEAAISAGFDSGRLAEGCAQGVLYRHGFKRVQHVLAATIHGRRCAGQIDKEPLQWSRQIYIPYDSKYSPEFEVQSSTTALNLFAGQVFQAYQALELFGLEHCVSGEDSLDYTGRVLVMSPNTLREECWDARNMLWLAEGGFGCSPTASGRAVYATCLGDGEQARWNRADFLGVLKDELLPDWAREKLDELRAQKQSGPVMGGMA